MKILATFVSGDRLARDASDPLLARSLDEYMDIEATENSDLLDLAGDHASLTRNFVHGRCTIGFSATLPALRTLPPSITQEIIWNTIWNMQEYGAAEGQFVFTENSHGMGPYIPDLVKILSILLFPLCSNVLYLI